MQVIIVAIHNVLKKNNYITKFSPNLIFKKIKINKKRSQCWEKKKKTTCKKKGKKKGGGSYSVFPTRFRVFLINCRVK